ncbi:CHAD domain-containing protein [Methanolobus mangrovi]|uniref:CHAD domain-containing protein n=1 Tax=Methanolobus mangrovi TaxID=3072977 RepID=A0AA51UDM1_9EURY|nr:CHAD domain-containing protein [Methanolobus mangrovi]WMW21023.1 CHAD domain-containing protein [Methanolobus mangrovi]
MTGLLFAIVSRLSRSSGSEVILIVCFLLGFGILLILAGINIAGIRRQLSQNYSFIAGMLLSVTGVLMFVFSFPDNCLYPRVSYVIIFYSLGIFLLLINIFANYFLQAFESSKEQGTTVQKQCSVIANEPDQHNDCSVLATFAGILITNITTASYEPAFLTNTSGSDDTFIVTDTASGEKQPESQIMENTEENTMSDPAIAEEIKEDNSFIEPTALETTQFPEIVEIPETEDIGIPEKTQVEDIGSIAVASAETLEISASDMPVVPFSEFRSMKKTDIKATDTMRDAARKILMFHFGVMVEHERGTKVGKDIEQLHDMRVAAMRMRSAIEVLEDYLDMKKMFSHYRNIKSTRRVLGSVRDLDVFLEKIDHYLEGQSPEIRIDMDPLTDSILIEKAKQRGNMLEYLDDVKYNKFKNNFADYLLGKKAWKMKSINKNGEPVPCRVMDVLPVLLYTQFAAVRAYDEVISDETVVDPSLEKYHQLRIDVKILRYTLEFFKEVLGSESRDLIRDLKALQDNLGDMHDTVVALELLENFEKYGRWGEVDKKSSHASTGLQDYPGVDAYLEYRKQELQNLLDTFPDVWSKVIDPDFSVRFSQSISGIYLS